MGLKDFSINILLVSIFAFFLISGITLFLTEKNPNSEILTNYSLGDMADSYKNIMNKFNDTSNKMNTNLNADTPDAVYLFLIFKQAFWIPLDILKLVGESIKSFGQILFPSLSGNAGTIMAILVGLVITILLFTLILYIIKFIRTGESQR